MTTDEVGRRFRYDARNRIVGATDSEDNPIIDFSYDALNRRIQEIRPSETRDLFYSADWQLLEEQVNAVAVMHYVWSPVYVDALVLRDGADSGDPQPVLYALQDANFNVTGIVDTGGSVQERYVYDPYGAVTVLTTTCLPLSGTQFGWNNYHQGLRFVIDVCLYYNRWRDYSPTLMRFVQQDPIGRYTHSTNLYFALTNNPLIWTDAPGLQAVGGGLRIFTGRICFPSGIGTLLLCLNVDITAVYFYCGRCPNSPQHVVQIGLAIDIGLFLPGTVSGTPLQSDVVLPWRTNWDRARDLFANLRTFASQFKQLDFSALKMTVQKFAGPIPTVRAITCPTLGFRGGLCITGSIGFGWLFTVGARLCVTIPGAESRAEFGQGIGIGTGIAGTVFVTYTFAVA